MKLVYILNHYSAKSQQHFGHVIGLVEEMALQNVDIALIIEKAEGVPIINHPNIHLYILNKSKWGRTLGLVRLLYKLSRQGYNRVFIRISWLAAVIAIKTSWISGQKTYYWLSGQGAFENYETLNFGLEKLKLLFQSRLPFWFIKSFIYKFVTGPEAMAEYYIEKGGVSAEKIMILYNDIDVERFKKRHIEAIIDYKKHYQLPLDKKIILFVHRFSPVRRTLYYIPFIIEEFFRITKSDRYIFVFAGTGPETKQVLSTVNHYIAHRQVIYLGGIPNAEVNKLYSASDIFINPTYAEGFPRVLIEAMASDLPIVTTDAGGIKDILSPGQLDFMVAKDDRSGFVTKLIDLALNESLQQKIAKENSLYVRKYSTPKIAKMYINKIFT